MGRGLEKGKSGWEGKENMEVWRRGIRRRKVFLKRDVWEERKGKYGGLEDGC